MLFSVFFRFSRILKSEKKNCFICLVNVRGTSLGSLFPASMVEAKGYLKGEITDETIPYI